MTKLAKLVGWAIVAGAAGVWVRILAIGVSTECTSGCLENGLWAVVALLNVAAGQMMSTAATQIDRRVSPGVLSNASQWIVATVVCLAAVAAGGLAVVNSVMAGPVYA